MNNKLVIDVCDSTKTVLKFDGECLSYKFPLTGLIDNVKCDNGKITISFIEETTHRLIYIILKIREEEYEKIIDKLS